MATAPGPKPDPLRDAARLVEGIAARATADRDAPLVTCIMPTVDRPAFARNAVRLFEAQDYPHRELVVVVEESAEGLERSLPPALRIRCVHAPPGESIGRKRNRACAAAAGEYIAHWDDDDWYGASRLSTQLEPLIRGRADVTGLMGPLFFDLSSWAFWAVTPRLHRSLFVEDVHGGTLVYRRALWQRIARYPDASLAEDARFLVEAKRRGARLHRIPAEGLFLYVRHGRNAWSFTCGEHCGPAGWLRVGEPPLPPEDRRFYLSRYEADAGPRATEPEGRGEDRGEERPAGVRGTPSCDRTVPAGAGDARIRRRGAPRSATPRRDGGSAWEDRWVRAPLVSCVMPTKDRPALVSRAVACFQRQDYANRELVVVDDGHEPVRELLPPDPRLRYVRLELPRVLGETIGAKRNLGCEVARGDVLVNWDDDDWYAPWRLGYQVRHLLSEGADVCGLSRLLYIDPVARRAWRYAWPASARPWVHDAVLMFTRDFWHRNPFPDTSESIDSGLLWTATRKTILALPDERFYVGMIHGSNTSAKHTRDAPWSPCRLEDIEVLLGDDLPYYRDALAPHPVPRTPRAA